MSAAKINKYSDLTKTRRKRSNNTPEIILQPKRIGNGSTKANRQRFNQSESATIQPKQNAGAFACISQAKRLQTTKKGDTGIRKPPDAYLPASHAGPKPFLFIGGRGGA